MSENIIACITTKTLSFITAKTQLFITTKTRSCMTTKIWYHYANRPKPRNENSPFMYV